MRKVLLPIALFLTVGLGWAWAQGAGGAFVPSFNYIVTGQWTWARSSPPLVLKVSSTAPFSTSLGFTTPTANRTITLPNASGTVALSSGGAAAIAAGNATINSNPKSITTGLATLTSCNVTPISATGPYAASSPWYFFSTQLTASAGRLDVYHWTTTGASTNPTFFSWMCAGT